ncbi:MAG: vitamin K-dependent gamma-carboxylase [Flavobacteriaceae bacterium]|jgi:vitamin K-dependent gamma-carboxylase
MTKLINWLNQPKSPHGLALFRILFGVILLWDLLRIKDIKLIESFYPRGVMFPYEFIDLPLIELESMNVLMGLLILSAVLITVGLFYRFAMLFFALGFSYFFFLDQVLYNNHLYLICLVSFMMVFMPADAALSVSKKRHRSKIPQWNYRLLQFQLIAVFFFGAIAKLNPYWFDMHPVEELLNYKAQKSGFGFLSSSAMKVFITYAGFLFDLLIGLVLLIPKTRKIGIISVILFNLFNAYIFDDIYIFPFFMMSAMFLFVDQDWLTGWLRKRKLIKPVNPELKNAKSLSKIGLGVIGIYLIIQLFLPLRHIGMDGYTDWTGEGQRFAWRMKIQHRTVDEVKFAIFDLDKKIIHPVEIGRYLYQDEITQMCHSPQMILQFSNYLKDHVAQRNGIDDPLVKSKIKVQFNGLPSMYVFDPNTDLLKEPKKHKSINDWIIPLSMAGKQLEVDPDAIPWD